MDDVNLDRVIVDKDGKTVRLEFIDMGEAWPVGVIECRDVILVNYHNVMDAEGLAIYVGQVDLDGLSGNSARTKLHDLGFKFRDALGRTMTTETDKVHHLEVAGGEVHIDLCCGDCRVTKAR